MDTTIGIVWNPTKCERSDLEDPAQKVLDEQGASASLHWFETTAEDPGHGPAREALEAGCTLVIAAGGDGTVRAVAEEVAGTEAHLGIIPQGTGNLLARNLDIPLGIDAAVEHALTQPGRAIDMGWAEMEIDGEQQTHGFLVMVGFGVDAQMITETDENLKDTIGWVAYAEAMGRAIAASDLVDLELGIDEADPQQVQGHTLLIANCGTITGGMRLLPDARPDDGLLDVLMVSAAGITGWADALKTLTWDNGLKRLLPGTDDEAATSDNVAQHQAHTLRVRLSSAQAVEIDGEEIGETATVTARLDSGALTVR
ncbi:diacylglycerol/lipid kinase family protein [Ruania alba]|uniref:Diacylglycerol kinase family enzyme n=1 Tax=Ruania alba TaxID=648782 RepID=A0A1H5H4Y1_9MICO|nr:diacylglycerol kinase family protein [Ruania alba]SEE22980.1 Diacylglycerol kinase family enzyme [Ruania alba]